MKRIEVFRLRVASAKIGHSRYVVAIFVALDDDRKFPLGFQRNLLC